MKTEIIERLLCLLDVRMHALSLCVFGLLIYLINFYLMTAVFPWFAMARGGIPAFAHAMFGLVLGWVYHAVASRKWAGVNDDVRL